MQTTARVQHVRDGRASLACETMSSACNACSGGRGCALRWLAGPGNGLRLEVAEHDTDGVRLVPGNSVVLEVGDGELLRAAMLAYLLPLVGLLAGPAVAALLADESEVTAILAAALGLATGWGASRAWLRRSPPRYQLRAVDRP
jgi:positive regulator of sigma E activity